MRRIFIISILCGSLLSCHNDIISDTTELPINHEIDYQMREKNAQHIAKDFYKIINSFDKSNSRRKKLAYEENICIEPITTYNDVDFIVANYPDNNGYIIIKADSNYNSIVAFNTTGNLHYNELSADEKFAFDSNIAPYSVLDSTGIRLPIDLEPRENEDVSTEIEIGFDVYGGEVLADDINLSTFSFRRNKPVGYHPRYPMMYGFRIRQWHSGMPYNFDMPQTSLSIDGSGYVQASLPSIAVSLALVMDYVKTPDGNFWNAQPSELTENTSTSLSVFLKELAFDCGFKYAPYRDFLDQTYIFENIPLTLQTKYGFEYTTPVEYYRTKYDFINILRQLQNNHPVILIKNYGNPVLLYSAFVIDAVQECYAKFVDRKFVAGILVSEKTSYYYTDFIHYVSPYGRQNDLWLHFEEDKLSPSGNRGQDYLLMLEKKY